MTTENRSEWQMTEDHPEGETSPWYGICRRKSTGETVCYRELTQDALRLDKFLAELNHEPPEECHVADVINDLVTSLYIPHDRS